MGKRASQRLDVKSVIHLRRRPFTPPSRKGEAVPVCGRKFCTVCGRWRLAYEFDAHTRTTNGAVIHLQSRCQTCNRLVKRLRYGHKPRPPKMNAEARRLRRIELNRKRRNDPVRGPLRREYEVMYLERRRRAKGIPERPIGPRSRKWTAPGSPSKRVPNEPLRTALAGRSTSEIARAIGWVDDGRPDGRRVKRVLGITGNQQTISIANAQLIAKATGVLPASVGV